MAEVVAEALEKRMAFRRAMKKAIQTTVQAGAKGVKVEISGRLGGAEMARTAKEREGRVPLDAALERRLRHGHARTTRGDRRQGLDLQGRHRAGREGRLARRSERPTTPRRRPRARSAPSANRGAAAVAARRNPHGVDAQSHQVPQAVPAAACGAMRRAATRVVRRLRPAVARLGLDHRAADRGRSRGRQPRDRRSGEGLDPDLPAQAGVVEAGRGAHGHRQGRRRVLGRDREPGTVLFEIGGISEGRPRWPSSASRTSCPSRSACPPSADDEEPR